MLFPSFPGLWPEPSADAEGEPTLCRGPLACWPFGNELLGIFSRKLSGLFFSLWFMSHPIEFHSYSCLRTPTVADIYRKEIFLCLDQ